MKKAFTLLELLVVLTIITLLLSIGVPTYHRIILKQRTEEAKATIQALAFAEERYKQEMGEYFPKNIPKDYVKNENNISKSLKVDLSKSNNFVYFIYDSSKLESDNGKDGNYTIRAYFRKDLSECSSNDYTYSTKCKQSATENVDSWMDSAFESDKSDFNENENYIEFRYPSKYDSQNEYVSSGINYENLY